MQENKKWVLFSEHSVATTADQYKVVYDLSIGAIFSDHERPSCQVLIDWLIDWQSRQYLTLNMALMVQDRYMFTPTLDN